MRKTIVISLLVLALGAAALGGSTADSADARALKSSRLQAFGSCGQLLGHVKRKALPLVGAYGVGAGDLAMATTAPEAAANRASGGTAGVDFSTTNVQEEGVDEPDLVKTNGSHVFVVRNDRLFAVDVRAKRPKLVGSLALNQGWGGHELLLHGDRLLVLTRGGGQVMPMPGIGIARMSMPYLASETTLTEVSVADPGNLKVVRSMKLDADYVSARLVGASARIVTVSRLPQKLQLPPPTQPTPEGTAAAVKRNKGIVRSSKIRSWLPSFAVRGRKGETLVRKSLVGCRDVRRPASYSGLGMLTVLTIDLKRGLAPVDSDAVLTDATTVYASTTGLYVATQRWTEAPAGANADPTRMTTAIHKFDISDPLSTQYRGSGTVSGYLFSQWALSEHDGVLRVASTEEPTWWNPGPREQSESFVTTLREQGGGLAQIGRAQIGRVGGLGKGERVYAVRFIGDKGYVVTFRQVDPLYTLDLANPARPVVLGELKILGYSAYLHPLGEDLLLGVGQDATEEGRTQGTQLSVFDVSDLRRPTRLHHWTLGSSWSEAESDHHAFLWWPRERLAVLPVSAYDPAAGPTFSGAVGFRIGRATGIREVVKVSHPLGASRPGELPIRRSLVVGDALYTVSDGGVQATGLKTFADEGWAAFPQPQVAGGGSSGSGGTTP
jgi:uncharacterized secreted protein with C-terminal beta-propeller domain